MPPFLLDYGDTSAKEMKYMIAQEKRLFVCDCFLFKQISRID